MREAVQSWWQIITACKQADYGRNAKYTISASQSSTYHARPRFSVVLPIRDFQQLNREDVAIAGGKGASLDEMTKIGIPVPPGFVILSTVFERVLEETGQPGLGGGYAWIPPAADLRISQTTF